jgi:predicted TIM-barrel fold metal-dependent hydrolase
MVIDCHAHLVAPDTLFAFRSVLLTTYGHIDPPFVLSDEALAKSAGANVALLDEVGTDIQLLSPRPYQQMQSAKPSKIVHRWISINNDTIARTCAMHPDRFYGVAGLPVCAGEPVESSFDELDRALWAYRSTPTRTRARATHHHSAIRTGTRCTNASSRSKCRFWFTHPDVRTVVKVTANTSCPRRPSRPCRWLGRGRSTISPSCG